MIRDLFKDMTKYLPAQIVPGIVGFISIPIITRLFPPGDYGNYVLVIAIVNVFSIMVGWLSMSIIRFYPAYERDKKLNEFYANIIKLTIISILFLSLSFSTILLIIKSYISANMYSLIRVGILVFILTSGFGVLQHFLRAKRQVDWYSGFTVWKSIGTLSIGIALIMIFHLGIDGLLWGAVLSIGISLPLLWRKAVEGVSFGSKTLSTSLTSQMVRYGFPLVVGNLAAWILSLSDRYILEFFRGSQEVGIYSASYQISEHSIFLLASLFMLPQGPIGMNIWEKEGVEKSREFVAKVTRYYLIICFPAVVGLSILAKPAISVLTASTYYEGYRIVPLVALGGLFLGLQQRFHSGLTFHKRTHLIMLTIIASALLNLGLNLLLVPTYGYMAAAVTTLISYAFLLAAMVVISRRHFIWDFPFKSLAKAACASTVMAVAVYPVGNSLTSSVLLNLVLGICIGMVVYMSMLFLLKEPRKEEMEVLYGLKDEIMKRVLK